ncbi:MAG: cation-transporting P-type ATPase, partial [Actinomycetota bacterium]
MADVAGEGGVGSDAVTPDGLTSAEAAARLRHDGPNALPAPRTPSPLRQLAAQMTHFFALMLWVAGGLAFAAGLPRLGVAIFVIVVVNGAFAFAQEYRAERAVLQLHGLMPRRATVRRDGVSVEIDATDLVVGDLVLLVGGDRLGQQVGAHPV